MKINGHLEFHVPGGLSSDGQIKNAIIEVLSEAPATGAQRGRIYYNDGLTTPADKGYWYHDGSTWVKFASGGNTASLQNEIDAIELTIGDMINSDGTANTANMNALTNVTGANDLSDVLTQLDAAISSSNELSELDDVTITGAADGNILYYDNGEWVNGAPGATSGVQPYDAGLANLATGGSGIVVMDGDTVSFRTLTASTANDELGLSITNGSGVGGQPTIGLDVVGLTAVGAAPADDDALFIYDLSTTTNKKVTVANLKSAMVGANALGDLSDVTDAATGSLVTDDKYFFNATGASAYEVTAATLGALNNVADGVDSATTEDVLAFDGTQWTAITVATMIGDANLADLGDVSMVGSPAPADGDVLQYNSGSGNWENASLTGAGAAMPYDAGLAALAAAGTGIVSMDGDNVYFRTLTASAAAGLEGINVVNADGTGGNPTIGINIDTLTDGGVPASTEKVMVFDGTNNVTATIAQLADAVIATDINLNDLADVTAAGSTSGTGYILVGDGAGGYSVDEVTPSAPTNFVEAVQDMIGTFIVDGTDTTVNYADGSNTLAINVDDVFLRNTGDTLDSGVLTVASGAQITIATGGKLVITDAPVDPTDAANKAYVDSAVEGLQTRRSVHAASTGNLAGTFTAGSGSPWAGATLVVASGSPTFDGETLVIGNRVLLKDQTAAEENGIWYLSAGTGSPINGYTLTRCDCTDESDEVSGAYTFVESGNTYANTGWVLAVDDPDTFDIDSDPITAIQFSGAGSFTAGDGLGQLGTEIFLEIGDLTSATITLADGIAFDDSSVTASGNDGATRYTTVQQFLDDLDILTGDAGGNAITASDGVLISGQDVQLDINGLSDLATTADDYMVFADYVAGSPATYNNHIKRTVADFLTDHNIVTSTGGGALTGSDGIVIDGSSVQMDIGALSAAAIVSSDVLVFNDGNISGAGATHAKITAANFLAQLNVVNGIAGTGLVAVTDATSGAQVMTNRSIVASADNDQLGIEIVNGNAVSGNPEVGLDIAGRTALGAAPASGDLFMVYDLDVTTNKSVTMANLASGIQGLTDLTDLGDVDTTGVTNGNILTYSGGTWVDGTDEWTISDGVGSTNIGLGDTMTLAEGPGSDFTVAVDASSSTVTLEVSGATTALSDVSSDVADVGQALVHDGVEYKPVKFHAVEPGTGTTWVISHNLDQQYVNVTVVDDNDQVIIPQSITMTDANTVTITFNTSVDGFAICTGCRITVGS